VNAATRPGWWTHPPTLVTVVGLILAGLLAASVVSISPILTLGVAVAGVGTLFFLVRPVEALTIAIVFRVFLDILWWVPFEVGGLNLSQLFSGAVFVMLIVILLLKARALRRHPATGWALAMIGLLTLATVRAIDLAQDVDILVRYYSTPLMLLATTVVFDTPRLRRRIVVLISLAAVVPIGVSMYKLGTGMSGYVLHGYMRLLGGYKNIHNHALVMMCFSLLFLGWSQSVPKRWQKWGAMGLSMASVVAVYYTYTRTGMLGWAVSILGGLILLKRYRLVGMALLLGSVFVLMDPTVQDRFSDLISVFDPTVRSVDRRSLGSGRWGLWSWSMQTYLAEPPYDWLIGLGLGGHRLTTLDWSRSFHRMGLTLDPHNDYLLYLYQMGPFGVLAYLGMVWVTFKASFYVAHHTTDNWARYFAASVGGLSVGVVVTNGVSNSFIHRSAPGWYYWSLAGIVIGEYIDLKAQIQAQARAARPVAVLPPGALDAPPVPALPGPAGVPQGST